MSCTDNRILISLVGVSKITLLKYKGGKFWAEMMKGEPTELVIVI